MSWFFDKPYVSVAERRRLAEKEAKKLAGKGQVISPVKIEGRGIATTFWGKAWCVNLESYSDYANRLPRGRTYVRNGSVIDLQIAAGKVTALVQGSSLYRIKIEIGPLGKKRWDEFKKAVADKPFNLIDLLQGKLSKEILIEITAKGSGLFPSPREITLDCSCPDGAQMCKHVAATLYGVGARLDKHPELFFTLRGVDVKELFVEASATATAPAAAGKGTLAEADLSDIFGVELETDAVAKPKKPAKTLALPKKAIAPKGNKSTKPVVKKPDKRPSGPVG